MSKNSKKHIDIVFTRPYQLDVFPSIINLIKSFQHYGYSSRIFCFYENKLAIPKNMSSYCTFYDLSSKPLKLKLLWMRMLSWKNPIIWIDEGHLKWLPLVFPERRKNILFSLEIIDTDVCHQSSGIKGIISRWLWKIALKQKICFIIIQCAIRKQIFLDCHSFSHSIREEKFIFFPNSYWNATVAKHIPKERMMLYSGKLASDRFSEKLLESLAIVSKILIIEFRGWYLEETFINYLRDLCKKNKQRMRLLVGIFNETVFDEAVARSMIGFAWYPKFGNRTSSMVGFSAGKIFKYMQFGVPFICNDRPGISYLAQKGAGIAVKNESEIFEAVKKILADYEGYSQRTRQLFKSEFEMKNIGPKAIKRIVNYIENSSK